VLIVSLLVAFSATPALAITDGAEDGNGHPMVGIMVAKNAAGDPLWRCSGTMLTETVFLTAGHCTEEPAARAEIWFQPNLHDDAGLYGYPLEGQVDGVTHTHPEYYKAPWWLHDLGVVKLDGGDKVMLSEYASLPQLDSLDKFQKKAKKNKAWFTAVGYGLQKAFTNPKLAAKEEAFKIRKVAYPKLIQINVPGSTGAQTLILSNNTNTGGTCFGDSGGPNFLKDKLIVAGVTSFGKNGQCAGQGGVYRVDRADDLEWLEEKFGVTPP
jgi:V8-like Glu-specific endopeptidase